LSEVVKRTFFATLLFLACVLPVSATHIVGGELIYDYLGQEQDGSNIYRITLKIFRDCGPGTAQFDGLNGGGAFITVLDADGTSHGVFDIGAPIVTQVPPTINSPCMEVPNSVCVELGVYTYTISLMPRTGGYYVVYQRCCRNNTILNITVSGNQGSTYFAFIPGPELAPINSSPRFNAYPPIFLCLNFDFSYTQSAVDPDGDQLKYTFSTPYKGLDVCCPALNVNAGGNNCNNPPPSCPNSAPPGPYDPVTYMSPYSASYPAASNPSLAIDPATGAMSGAPTLGGQFVVNVLVEEYRNGTLISKHFRDFQFNMLPCSGVLSQFKTNGKCEGFNLNFTNTSFNGSQFLWDFGVPGTSSDVSTEKNANYTFPDTGSYVVKLIVNPGENCSDTAEQTVKVYPPLDITFTPPKSQCMRGNSFVFNGEGVYGTMTKFNWDFSSAAEPSKANTKDVPGVHFSKSGTYFIKLLAKHYACADSILDTVQVLPMPVVEVENPGLLCAPAVVKLKNKLPTDFPTELNWRVSDGRFSKQNEPVFEFKKPSVFQVYLTGISYGKCRDSTYRQFEVSARPKAEFEVYPKSVTVLEPEVSIRSLVKEPVYYLYLFSDGTNDDFMSGKHSFYEEGKYFITQRVVNYFGCTDSVTDFVTVLPEHRFWIPNVFTPDGNGLNDTFGPFIMGASDYSLEIFNRWGTLIFTSTDPFIGWDGKENGKKCAQGTYAYKLVFRNDMDGSHNEKLGHVTLIRNE
jgi:gliding motility-associated-like protein